MIQKARPEFQKARPEFPKTYQVARRDTPSEVARRVAWQSDAQYEVTVGGQREREGERDAHAHAHTKWSSKRQFKRHIRVSHFTAALSIAHDKASQRDGGERSGARASGIEREPRAPRLASGCLPRGREQSRAITTHRRTRQRRACVRLSF